MRLAFYISLLLFVAGFGGFGQAAHAGDDTFSCYDQFGGPVLKKFSGDLGYQNYELFEWSQQNVRFDARGAIFRQQYNKDGTFKPSKIQVVVGGGWAREPSPAACWVGGTFIGSTPLDATYRHIKDIGGAGITMNSNGGIIDGVRMHNIHEDAFRHVNGNNASRKDHKTKVLRNSWVSFTKASFLEDDHVANLHVDDVLIDGSFNGLSTDPGGNYSGGGVESKNTVTISNSLIKLLELPNSRVAGSGDTAIYRDYLVWIKTKANVVPKFRIKNTIFATDGWQNSSAQSARQQDAWDNMVECSNNTIAWMSDAPFPPPSFPMPPSNCFKIVKGQAAIDLWNAAKRNWINCHPKVGRVPEDPTSDYSKCDESAYGGGGSGTPSGDSSTGGSSTGGTTGPVVGLCNLFEKDQTPPQGYGAAWNPFNSSQGLLLNSNCKTSSVELRVGTADFQTQYVYKQGYIYKGAWQPFTLSGNLVSGSDAWLQGQGSYTLNNPPSGTTHWVGYMCHWDAAGTKWNCGCRDQACTTPYWQLQGMVR